MIHLEFARPSAVASLLVVLGLLAFACGGPIASDGSAVDGSAVDGSAVDGSAVDAGAGGGALTGQVVVQAAASLADAFGQIAADLESENPGLEVVLNLAGSQSLATQILQGAPADVFASANGAQMDAVAGEGLVSGQPEVFATNRLAIVVEVGNPFGITGLADLADPEIVVVLAAPDVPAGGFAAVALDSAGVAITPASFEVDVRATLSRVELGEADAAIVYASDLVTAGPQVEGVAIPDAQNVIATYPIVGLRESPNPAAARAFIDSVLSPEGQAVLAEHGFGPA